LKAYFPHIILIFFFNSFLLPHGLVFTTVLFPVFVYWLYKKQQLNHLIVLLPILALFGWIHWRNGADAYSLTLSSLLFVSSFAFLVTLRQWLTEHRDLRKVFMMLLSLNALFIFIALITLPYQPLRELFWYAEPISNGIKSYPRLRLFTYEASYYALLFAPVAIYFFWKIIAKNSRHWLLISLAVVIPLALSFSLGVIGAAALALVLSVIYFWNGIITVQNAHRKLIYTSLAALIALVVLWEFYPENALFARLTNVFTGADTSAKGRLFDSFIIAWNLAATKSLWFGIGLGQIKLLGYDAIMEFYHYRQMLGSVMRIPNSMAEWLATFGLIGFVTKLAFEIGLFFKRKVYRNPVNLSLFLFIFIYQFTGSYIVNPAEIMIWMLAIYANFDEVLQNEKTTNT